MELGGGVKDRTSAVSVPATHNKPQHQTEQLKTIQCIQYASKKVAIL